MEKNRKQKVLFIDDLPAQASLGAGYPRALDHISYLKKQDKEIFYLFSNNLQINKKLNFDIIICSRPNNFLLGLNLALQNNVPLIYDAESLFYLKQQDNYKYQEYLKIEKIIAKKADGVIAISPPEAQWFKDNGAKNVWLIDPFPETCNKPISEKENRAGAVMVAGWLSGPRSPNHEGLDWFFTKVLPLILKRQPDFCLKVTGANPPVELIRKSPKEIEFVGEIDNLYEYLSTFLFSINPMRRASGVNLKIVDSLSCCVPVVSTLIGSSVPDKKWRCGMLSTDSEEYFAECCLSLIKNQYYYNNIYSNLKQICISHQNNKNMIWKEIFDFYQK